MFKKPLLKLFVTPSDFMFYIDHHGQIDLSFHGAETSYKMTKASALRLIAELSMVLCRGQIRKEARTNG